MYITYNHIMVLFTSTYRPSPLTKKKLLLEAASSVFRRAILGEGARLNVVLFAGAEIHGVWVWYRQTVFKKSFTVYFII